MSQGDLPSRGIGKDGLDARPVVVCVQEEGNGNEQDEDDAACY